jgi:glycosyltransferase involved in cell wall biosynthesis
LDIVGQIADQNYRKQLESIIEKDGLEGQVSFAGQLERRELWQRMRRATMVWVPSLCEEAFGLVAAEAMACGAVAVVSNRGALPEVVGDAGIVAEPTAEAGAADAAGVLAMPEGDRATLAQAAAKRARDKFRLSKVVKQVESVLTGKNHA